MHADCPSLRRREFLATGGVAALGGLFLPKLWGADAPAKTSPSVNPATKPAAAVHPPVDPNHKALVGIARGSNMEDAVRLAVGLAGGLSFIKPDQTVLIKPNVTGAARFPTTTNPEVLYAVIKLVSECGPKRIYVSDRCFSPAFTEVAPKTINVMKYVGQLDAVEAAKKDFKAPVVALGLEAAAQELEHLGRPRGTPLWRRIKPANAAHWPNGFEQAELLFAVDHVINVPVIKTHFQAWFTMSMKAFVGMSHHRSRLEFHRSLGGDWSLFRQKARRRRRRGIQPDVVAEDAAVAPFVNRIAELNLGIRPAMNILDGTRSFVFGGPSQGDTADPKLIVASTDRIAADATGVAILKSIGTEPRLQNRPIWSNPFLRHGIKIGLGIGSPDQLVLKDAGIPDREIERIRVLLTETA
ncbi:MAG TPA: DUF362 domain-containing protein [Planctomycetaceae bacterium]|jgi:uncharacterized protein (DUF362 family)|nr:DUF362 domain-containing protein [Planctomycetaceae bacterium]